MRGDILWSHRAREDLRAIGDSSVAAQIMHIANNELMVIAEETPIQGFIVGSDGDMWRRAVPKGDLDKFTDFEIDEVDDFRCQACDYILIYREISNNQKIRFRRRTTAILIRRVIANADCAGSVFKLTN